MGLYRTFSSQVFNISKDKFHRLSSLTVPVFGHLHSVQIVVVGFFVVVVAFFILIFPFIISYGFSGHY